MNENEKWFKIKEVEQLTGISRRTVHFYLQSGLLHPPKRTGKTMAYYDQQHIRKLKDIVELKRQGLPLFAIRERISGFEHDEFLENTESHNFHFCRHDIKNKRLPQRLQGKKTRENIIGLAASLFKEKGYKETKISDITSRLNIGKGSFYSFFNNKKGLFLECTPIIFKSLFSKGWEEIHQEKDPLKRLELRMEIVLPVRKEFTSIIKLSKEVLEDDDPNLKRLGKEIINSIRKPMESDIKKSIDKGMMPRVDPKIISMITLVLIENIDFILSVDKDFSQTDILNQFYEITKRVLSNS